MCLDDVAADFPELEIVLAHPSFPWQDEAISVCLHKANVWIDLSGWSPKYFPPQLVQYANTQLKTRVLFGSDYPLITPDRWLADFEQAPFKDEVRPLILKENAAACSASTTERSRPMNTFEQAVYDCMNPTAELLEKTTNPLHRAMLLNFWRHVHLEGAGEYERIVAPDMMVDEPVYRVTLGRKPGRDPGKEGVLAFYRSVGESVLWHSDDLLSVARLGHLRRDHIPPARARRRPEGGRLRRRRRRGPLPRLEPAGVHLAVRRARRV